MHTSGSGFMFVEGLVNDSHPLSEIETLSSLSMSLSRCDHTDLLSSLEPSTTNITVYSRLPTSSMAPASIRNYKPRASRRQQPGLQQKISGRPDIFL